MSRPSSKRSCTSALTTLVVLLVCGGCRSQVPATFASASEHPDEDRRPDGVAVDLTSEPPGPRIRADATDKVVTLVTPLSVKTAMTSVRGFFAALRAEDITALLQAVDSAALVYDTKIGAKRSVVSLSSLWRQRFRQHVYQELATRLIYREADVRTYRGDQLAMLPVSVRYLPLLQPSPTDVVLRVPIVTHSIDNRRVFGDELIFWLRRESDRFVIYRVAEDVPL